jgi:hypothetical protein
MTSQVAYALACIMRIALDTHRNGYAEEDILEIGTLFQKSFGLALCRGWSLRTMAIRTMSAASCTQGIRDGESLEKGNLPLKKLWGVIKPYDEKSNYKHKQ